MTFLLAFVSALGFLILLFGSAALCVWSGYRITKKRSHLTQFIVMLLSLLFWISMMVAITTVNKPKEKCNVHATDQCVPCT